MKYVIGDATQPQGDGNKIIIHICNDLGLWGAGFVVALSKKWSEPEAVYKAWARGDGFPFGLGYTRLVKVEPDTWVLNMVAQRGVRNEDNPIPLDERALEKCLWAVDGYAYTLNATVHMPRIGCGLAGGEWKEISTLINKFSFSDTATVYDLE